MATAKISYQRMTLSEQISRNPSNRGRPLAATLLTPRGEIMRACDVLGKNLQEIEMLAKNVDVYRTADLFSKLGIKMVSLPKAGIEMSETVLSNWQFERLIRRAPGVIADFINDPQELLKRSVAEACSPSVAGECPLVLLDHSQAKRIANLIMDCRLPTDHEWIKAAQGSSFTHDRGRFGQRGTIPVKIFTPTKDGIYDLTGNVYQWTDTWTTESHRYMVIAGGYHSSSVIDAFLNGSQPEKSSMDIGVRLVRDVRVTE